MKTVFNNSSDVIHLFAQQSQYEARCGNVFFEGTRIYSYGRHYLLAEILDANNILINDKGYSTTTAKHISQVSYATRQYNQWFIMQSDQELVSSQLRQLKTKLLKAKKPELYINQALSLIASFQRWIEYSGKIVGNELSDLIEFWQGDFSDVKKRISDNVALLAKQQLEAFDKFAQAFHNFEPFEQLRNKANSKFDLVRISPRYSLNENGTMDQNFDLETSQFVRVPIESAYKLYKALKLGINIVGERIEHYQIRDVSDDVIKIGCHNIRISELDRTFSNYTNN